MNFQIVIQVIPMNARTMFSPEEIRKMANATLGWWNHGHPCHDTMDKVDPEMMKKNMRAVAATAYEICTRVVLPINFIPTADEMTGRLNELNTAVGTEIKLSSLLETVQKLRSKVEKLESVRRDLEKQTIPSGKPDPKLINNIQQINGLLIRLSRTITPAFASVAGRYGQDPYGLTHLKSRFPGLYHASFLAGPDKESDAHCLLLTECMRQRNRISDCLHESLWHVDHVLGTLE
jgi:hypothetical protein